MNNNLKTPQVISLIKQYKSKTNLKYSDISKAAQPIPSSKLRSPVKTLEILLARKNRDEIPIVSQQNPQFKPKKQTPTQIYEPKTSLGVLPSQKFEKYVQKKSLIKVIEKKEEKNVIKIQNTNPLIKYQLLFVKAQVNRISSLKPKNNANKQNLISHADDDKKQDSELSTQMQSIQQNEDKDEVIAAKNSEPILEEKEKKKDGIALLKLQIRNQHEINVKLNQLQNQLNQTNQKINLKLETYFENYQALLNFCTKFLRFGHTFTYLSWYVKGYFQDDGTSDIISELVSRFQNLYRFDFHIINTSFSDSGAISFAKGLRKMVKLEILSFNVVNRNGPECISNSRKSVQAISQAIAALPNLQILNSKNQAFQYCNPSPKLSNFNYNFNCEGNQFCNKHKQATNFKQQERVITNINLRDCDKLESLKKQEQMTKLKQIFNLPFLTRVDITKYTGKLSKEMSQFTSLIKQSAFSKKRNIYQIISFQKIALQYLTINPVMVMTDLWID